MPVLTVFYKIVITSYKRISDHNSDKVGTLTLNSSIVQGRLKGSAGQLYQIPDETRTNCGEVFPRPAPRLPTSWQRVARMVLEADSTQTATPLYILLSDRQVPAAYGNMIA